jgi:hypothetical protein
MAKIALIVAADEPALFVSSIEWAEQALEAIDVEDGVYTAAFGPGGEVYDIETEGTSVRFRLWGNPRATGEADMLLLSFFKTAKKVEGGER